MLVAQTRVQLNRWFGGASDDNSDRIKRRGQTRQAGSGVDGDGGRGVVVGESMRRLLTCINTELASPRGVGGSQSDVLTS